MKNPYRDKSGRFAKRPTPKKRKRDASTKRKDYRRKSVKDVISHVTPRRKKDVKKIPRKIRKIVSPKETPRRKRIPKKKPTPLRKKEWDTASMGDILDSYIEEFDLEEDDIGDYRDPFQHLYEMLRSKRYRHSSLLVTDEKLIPWKSKPPRMQIWFLVDYYQEGRYNIEFRTWDNGDHVSLTEFVSYIHRYFIADQQASFNREAESDYKRRNAVHIIALQPIFVTPPTRKRKPRQGWKFNAPSLYKKNPPLQWKKGKP